MKLEKSKLCVNCEALYEQSAPCPYCGSEIFVCLSRVLGTVIEEGLEGMDCCGGEVKEIPTPETVFNKRDPFSRHSAKGFSIPRPRPNFGSPAAGWGGEWFGF